jgi:hypothetical protein
MGLPTLIGQSRGSAARPSSSTRRSNQEKQIAELLPPKQLGEREIREPSF